MKKRAVTLLSLTLVLVLMIGLVGCGGNAKKQEAIEKHTKVAAAFNEVAALVNQYQDGIDDDIIASYGEMSAMLNQFTEILNGDDLSDEKYDEMIGILDDVQDWVDETKGYFDEILAE